MVVGSIDASGSWLSGAMDIEGTVQDSDTSDRAACAGMTSFLVILSR